MNDFKYHNSTNSCRLDPASKSLEIGISIDVIDSTPYAVRCQFCKKKEGNVN